jgi:hypothetical protein
MSEKKRNQSPPIAEINMRRRFHIGDTSIVYAIRYVEEHPTNFGDVNRAILDTFHCFYAPLGIRAYGNSDEALQAAMRSISILEGHISYLKAMWGLTSSTVKNISYLIPNPSQFHPRNGNIQSDPDHAHSGYQNNNYNSQNGHQNTPQNTHHNGNGLSEEQKQAVSIYQSFDN